MALKVGDALDVRIEKAVYRGLGLARNEGQVVLVGRAVPGDRLRVRLESLTSTLARASIEEVLETGPGRRAPPCPYTPRCGGCAYQHVEPAAQRALKVEILRESLARAGIPFEGEIPVAASPEEGWRVRAHLHVARGALGFHEEGSHRLVDIERCLQMSERATRLLGGVRSALRSQPEVASKVHGVELAESMDGGRLVLALQAECGVGEAPRLGSLVRNLADASGYGVKPRRGPFVSLRGEPWVDATVLGCGLRSHVLSFFQSNRFLVEDLCRHVVDSVPPDQDVLDLFAGVGLFTLPLAQRAKRVRGADWSHSAVKDAKGNLARSGSKNARVEQGDVLSFLGSWRKEEPEWMVLDPPRTGLDSAVVAAVAARAPLGIVYVSCDPPTLGRDLQGFARLGYVLSHLALFDLFPDTFHIEAVARLSPAEPRRGGI